MHRTKASKAAPIYLMTPWRPWKWSSSPLEVCNVFSMRKKDQNNGGKKRSDISFQRHSQKLFPFALSTYTLPSLPTPPCKYMRLSKCITILKNLYLFYVPVDKVCHFLLFLSTSDILPISILNLQNNVSKHAYTLTYTHVPTRTYLLKHTHASARKETQERKILLLHQRHENVSLHNALLQTVRCFHSLSNVKYFTVFNELNVIFSRMNFDFLCVLSNTLFKKHSMLLNVGFERNMGGNKFGVSIKIKTRTA